MFIALVIVFSILLISCSNANENRIKEKDEQDSSSVTNHGEKIDERQEIMNMIEGQKQHVKHGLLQMSMKWSI